MKAALYTPVTDVPVDAILTTLSVRPLQISHQMTMSIPSSTINPYCYSFFINTPFLWNTIPLRILQLSDAKAFQAALHRFLFVWFIILFCVSCFSCECVCVCILYICICSFCVGSTLAGIAFCVPISLTKLIILSYFILWDQVLA